LEPPRDRKGFPGLTLSAGWINFGDGQVMSWLIPHYLDACVLVKLVCREPGSDRIDEYVRTNPSFCFCVTEYAFYEALGVLKRKWVKKELKEQEYSKAIYVLGAWFEDGTIKIDSDFRPHDQMLTGPLRDLVERHRIDYSDALQIYTIVNGKWKRSVYETKTVLVSQDAGLLKAARSEGLRVWEFPDGEPPEAEEAHPGTRSNPC